MKNRVKKVLMLTGILCVMGITLCACQEAKEVSENQNQEEIGETDSKEKDPKIIVMDEPSMGLSPILVNEIFDIIQEVSAGGTTVLLVEQNAKKALSIADRAYVLETGKIVLEGDAEMLMNDDSVKKAYLGE